MIQLNLLPDVKMQYIRAQRSRRIVLSVSFVAMAASATLLVLILGANGLQKKHIDDLTSDIGQETTTLQKKPDIDRILTVQNQLQSLTALHAAKPAVNRLFDYLTQVTPTQVVINNLNIDFATQTATITGQTDALNTVNKYVDTLKFTTYDVEDTKNTKAFSNVVMSAFGVSSPAALNGYPSTYTVTFNYDPVLFDVTKSIKLNVPQITTTRSHVDQPSALFVQGPASTTTTTTTTKKGSN